MPIIPVTEANKRLNDMLRDRRAAYLHDTTAWLPGCLDDILIRRHSVREFSVDPLPQSCVNAAVLAAFDAEAATWPARMHGTLAFEILVAAFRVDGTAAGLYAFRDFRSERDAVLAGSTATWFDALRSQYADAPVLLLVCGNLNQACQDTGPAGYPSMLVRSGTIGYAAWLWAVSAGLAGSVYGGASHRVTGAARQLDPNLRHLFTVALGKPALPDAPRDLNG
jgi:hypothetical protein